MKKKLADFSKRLPSRYFLPYVLTLPRVCLPAGLVGGRELAGLSGVSWSAPIRAEN
jgi:hypothetical protein